MNATLTTETAIISKLVQAALASGYSMDVNDGEETVLRRSTDETAIIGAMFSTDEDYLTFRDSDGEKIGWIYLIHGNGEDVISDLADNPEMNRLAEEAVAHV